MKADPLDRLDRDPPLVVQTWVGRQTVRTMAVPDGMTFLGDDSQARFVTQVWGSDRAPSTWLTLGRHQTRREAIYGHNKVCHDLEEGAHGS
jgi:hypothetical protein